MKSKSNESTRVCKERWGTIRVLVNLQLPSAALFIADVVKVFNPQSPQARAIFDLTIVVIVVMVVIFAVVVGIVLYALLRFP
jgi:heme/copper-type cytochrome/quinol oxidase subunit 2